MTPLQTVLWAILIVSLVVACAGLCITIDAQDMRWKSRE